MKAIVYEQYGPPEVLALKEVPKPSPKDHEILIKTYATTVTSADWRLRSLQAPAGFKFIMRLVFGFSKPRQTVLGSELAGVVESVGKGVTQFKAGDSVFAFSDAAMGCYAQYKCMLQDAAIALKPANLSYEEAAALSFGGTTALQFLRRAKLCRGERVLVIGASGGVGTAAVQLAKHLGADVTGVCSSTNMELVKSLGAKHVINYAEVDFTKNGETYDVIMDTVGKTAFANCKKSLTANGRFLMVAAGLAPMLQVPWVSLTSRQKIIAGPATGNAQDLRFLAELAAAGQFKPVIERCYPCEQIVVAHQHVDSGRKKGNIAVTWTHGNGDLLHA